MVYAVAVGRYYKIGRWVHNMYTNPGVVKMLDSGVPMIPGAPTKAKM